MNKNINYIDKLDLSKRNQARLSEMKYMLETLPISTILDIAKGNSVSRDFEITTCHHCEIRV